MPRIDMHAHLGFLPGDADTAAVFAGMAGVFNATVTPEEYAPVHARFAADTRVHTGVGLHPWYVAADAAAARAQSTAAARLIRPGSLVGEVGLDFAPRHVQTRAAQVDAFTAIARAAAFAGDCVFSVHAVRAADTALDILEAAGAFRSCTVILHWFSGSGPELTRATGAGAYFSVNLRMLAGKRGQAYARAIPADRLLLETDLPDADGVLAEPYAALLDRTLGALARVRDASVADLADGVSVSSARILDGRT